MANGYEDAVSTGVLLNAERDFTLGLGLFDKDGGGAGASVRAICISVQTER
ncbi:MAG: hypothetical protein ACLR56_03755 [Oscillospiraceae bacterium]